MKKPDRKIAVGQFIIRIILYGLRQNPRGIRLFHAFQLPRRRRFVATG
jgi:hypothetical protein